MVTIFDFNRYSDNPIVKYCISQYKDKVILSLDDVLPYIEKLNYAKWCYDKRLFIRMGNELRLYLSTLSDDFTYVDADSVVKDIDKLQMNCAYPTRWGIINEGTYFRACKDTEWTKFYIQKYETDRTIGDQGTAYIYQRYPYDVPTQLLDNDHYFVSKYEKFRKMFPEYDTIYYTDNMDKARECRKGVWLISEYPDRITNSRIFHLYNKLPLDLFKEQMQYTYGRELKFERI